MMNVAVNECPNCHKRIAAISLEPQIKHQYTEIHLSAYCPDCGYHWKIIYQPDNIEEE